MIVKPFDIKNINLADIVKLYVEKKYKFDITETIRMLKYNDNEKIITINVRETFKIENNPYNFSYGTKEIELNPELIEIAKELYELKKEATISKFEKLQKKLDFIYKDDEKWNKTKANFKDMLYCECNSVMYQIINKILTSRSMEGVALRQRAITWNRQNIPEKPTCN